MKTYKHKTLGWIAKPCTVGGFTVVVNDTDGDRLLAYYIDEIKDTVHHKLIENSQDREEVVEKDWKNEVLDTLYNSDSSRSTDKLAKVMTAITKHAPKVKKFIKEDVVDWYVEKYPALIYGHSISPALDFLSTHGLLEE